MRQWRGNGQFNRDFLSNFGLKQQHWKKLRTPSQIEFYWVLVAICFHCFSVDLSFGGIPINQDWIDLALPIRWVLVCLSIGIHVLNWVSMVYNGIYIYIHITLHNYFIYIYKNIYLYQPIVGKKHDKRRSFICVQVTDHLNWGWPLAPRWESVWLESVGDRVVSVPWFRMEPETVW